MSCAASSNSSKAPCKVLVILCSTKVMPCEDSDNNPPTLLSSQDIGCRTKALKNIRRTLLFGSVAEYMYHCRSRDGAYCIHVYSFSLSCTHHSIFKIFFFPIHKLNIELQSGSTCYAHTTSNHRFRGKGGTSSRRLDNGGSTWRRRGSSEKCWRSRDHWKQCLVGARPSSLWMMQLTTPTPDTWSIAPRLSPFRDFASFSTRSFV